MSEIPPDIITAPVSDIPISVEKVSSESGADTPPGAEQSEAPEGQVEAQLILDGVAQITQSRKAQLAAIRRDGRKPKEALENPKPKGGRGHFKQHLKTQLAQSGKLNAKKPMPAEQRRLRKRKRKK